MRTFISILIVFLIPRCVWTQTYHQFQAGNAKWGITLTDYWDMSSSLYFFSLEGDTLIDGNMYTKLYKSPYNVSYFDQDLATYTGAIYEDTGKIVYYVPAFESVPSILYNFGMQLLDTLQVVGADGTLIGVTLQLDTIINEEINAAGDVRKVYYLIESEGDLFDIWIEGIGSAFGLFELPWLATFGFNLTCYEQNGEQVYGIINNCMANGIQQNFTSGRLSVYPTLITEKTTITIPAPEIETLIIVSDLNGKVIMRKTAVNEREIELDLIKLSQGFYLISITNRVLSLSAKIVKV